MEEMLKDATLDLLLGGVEKKVTEVKDNYEWKKLFIDSGAFLSDNQDTLKSFGNDLYIVFSKDNMKEISRKLRDKRGYEFPQLLHDELYDLMIRYEISTKDAETYIHHFTQIIISYLEKNDCYKTLEIYLGEWRKDEEKNFFDLIQIIYKSEEDGDVVDKEKSDLANKVYSGFDKAKFCPTEKDGKVNYESLKEWLDKFMELLILQKQDKLFGNLIGRLLAYSPMGEDGYMPCEAVRIIIEEYYSESLKTSYVVAEENKRGFHTADAGKSEMKLHQKYKNNAEALQYKYPHTAEIYFDLSASYKWQADRERRRAEDEW